MAWPGYAIPVTKEQDLRFEQDACPFQHNFLDMAEKSGDFCCCGVVCIDNETCVLGRNLRTAQAIAFKTTISDQLAGKITGGSFECAPGTGHFEGL